MEKSKAPNQSILLLVYFFFVISYSQNHGFFSFGTFWLTLASLIIFSLYYFNPKSILDNFLNLNLSKVSSMVLLASVAFSLIYYDGSYQQKNFFYYLGLKFIALALLISITYLIPKLSTSMQRLRFPLLFSLALLTELSTIISSPHPRIDVFDQLKFGSTGLVQGKNPYSQIFPQIYKYPQDYFPYLPLTALVVLPLNLLLGDPRFAHIAANIIVVIILRKILSSQKNRLLAETIPLIYIYHPQMNFMIDQSWIDLIIFSAFAAFIYFYKFKGRGLFATFALTLSIGMKQQFPILILFLLIYKKIPKSLIFSAIAIVAIITIPFYIWSPNDFLNDVILIHINRKFWWHNSLTLNSFFFWEFRKDLPSVIMLIAWTIPLLAIAKRGIKRYSALTLSISLWFFVFYFFNYQAFMNYYPFISSSILLSVTLITAESNKMT